MLIPIAVIFFSFNDPAGSYNFTWVGFTSSTGEERFRPSHLNRRY